MMITDIEDYFAKGCGRCERFDTPDCSARKWNTGLTKLREICQSVGLEETVKWAHPCYRHAGRNISIIGAFRTNFHLSFFDAALLQNPERVLTPSGPNTKHPDIIRFTASDQVSELETTIRAYLREAMEHAARGLRPPKNTSMPDLPEELVEALAADPELSVAFDNLTPGRRKSYIINLNGAKKAETRRARIEKFRDKIFQGKGVLER